MRRSKAYVCGMIKKIANLSLGESVTARELTHRWGNGEVVKKGKGIVRTPAEDEQLWTFGVLSDITCMLKHSAICTGNSSNTTITSEMKKLASVSDEKLWVMWRRYENCKATKDCKHKDNSGKVLAAYRFHYDAQLQNAVGNCGLDMNQVREHYQHWYDRAEELRIANAEDKAKKVKAKTQQPLLGIVSIRPDEEDEQKLRRALLPRVKRRLLKGQVSVDSLSEKWLELLEEGL